MDLNTKGDKMMKNAIKMYFCLTLPICLIGCFLMILLEKMWETNFGLIPFFIWGFLSSYISEGVNNKFNLFPNE